MTTPVKKHYVQAWRPGSFMSEDTLIEVQGESDWPKVYPPGTYMVAHRYRWEQQAPDGTTMTGPLSGTTGRKIVGVERSIEYVRELQARTGGARTLLANMECNNWARIVECAQGALSLTDNDEVVERLP